MQLEDAKGNRLIALYQAADATGFAPLTHSLVVCRRQSEVLFVFNNWKQAWELPGGVIEAGESAELCARRELHEESGHAPREIHFYGVMAWRLGREQREEFGALYSCELAGAAQEIATDEIGSTRFWNLTEPIGPVAELDIALSRLVLRGEYLGNSDTVAPPLTTRA